jgi:hypothetical protein
MEKDITHAAAYEEGLAAVALKGIANRIGEFPGIHRMIMRLGELRDEEKVGKGDW